MVKLNLADDFSLLVDQLESITLQRRDSTNETAVEKAWRHLPKTRETTPSGGGALQADAVWHLQLSAGETIPQLGDVVVDQQDNRWTILETQELAKLGRWKCTTRELRLVYGCRDLVDIDRPVWGDNGSGPEIVDWAPICAALPVSIRLDEMILDTSTVPPSKELLYEIVLSESVAIEPDDRLVAEDGKSYRLQSLRKAERIDALPIAVALGDSSNS